MVRREPDLRFPYPDGPTDLDDFYLEWLPEDGEPEWLHFYRRQISRKHPDDALKARMLTMAAELDAWVEGDDCEIYEWDGERIVNRDRGVAAFGPAPMDITRGRAFSPDHPITYDEWMAAAGRQADFRIDTTIEARVPSGTKWIPCPPVVCWTGHPSGRLVRLFHGDDVVEVEVPDQHTARRMAAVAEQLGANVVTWRDEPAVE